MKHPKKIVVLVLGLLCLSAFADMRVISTETSFPYRECEGVKYNVTRSMNWTSIPPQNTYDDFGWTYWTAKVIGVRTNAIYIKITGKKNDREPHDDWHGRQVIILNHPRTSSFSVGDTMTPDFFHLLRTTNGVQVYDWGKPYTPTVVTNKPSLIKS